MKSVTVRLFTLVATALLALAPAVWGQTPPTLTTLHTFTGIGPDGANPTARLVQGHDGNFYGTTLHGGGSTDDGTVFKMTPAGILLTLHGFTGVGNDGANPYDGLVERGFGTFFGATFNGGFGGEGLLFSITSAGGTPTPLHSFTGNGTALFPDGTNPHGALLPDLNGNLYGTASGGGGADNDGILFVCTPDGTLTVLHRFAGTDGAFPETALVEGNDGNYYGTAGAGGGPAGAGTVFSLSPIGDFNIVHTFDGADGKYPYGALLLGKDGNFYGTTYKGGDHDDGTVFKMTPAGVLTTLHSFTGVGTDGAYPTASLVLGSDDNFYGTTSAGGSSLAGTIFSLSPAGVLTTLYSFTGGADGSAPADALVQGSDGGFYGTTFSGGGSSKGTVFKLTVTPSPGAVQFASAISHVLESAGNVVLTVRRVNGSVGAVSADYSETDGTAVAGVDYQPVNGTVSWADGDAADKTITIPITDRGLNNGNVVSVSVALTNPVGGATVGAVPAVSVNILDDEVAPQPTVVLTSPPDDLTVTPRTPFEVAASVTDPGGILVSVQFLEGGTPYTSPLTVAPYVFTGPAPIFPDQYTLTAVAVDNLGRKSTSTVTINVVAANAIAPPTASLLTPVDGLNLAAGSTIILSAAAAADVATALDHVNILVDGTAIATFDAGGNLLASAHGGGAPVRKDAGNPFTTTYTLPGVDQLLSLIVVAVDKLGVATVSGVATIHATVTTDLAPQVAITNLGSGTQVPIGVANPVEVSASDPDAGTAAGASGGVHRQSALDGALAKLAFYVDGALVGLLDTPGSTASFSFNPPSPKKYVLHSVATDASGLSTVSDPVVVTAAAPTVTVTTAGDGTALEGGENGKLLVHRTGDASLPLTVRYKAKGPAVAGVDYKPLSGSVTIPAGASKTKIKIKPLEDPGAGTRKVKVRLLPAADGSYSVGDPAVARIKVIAND